jgi:hypothetical protein
MNNFLEDDLCGYLYNLKPLICAEFFGVNPLFFHYLRHEYINNLCFFYNYLCWYLDYCNLRNFYVDFFLDDFFDFADDFNGNLDRNELLDFNFFNDLFFDSDYSFYLLFNGDLYWNLAYDFNRLFSLDNYFFGYFDFFDYFNFFVDDYRFFFYYNFFFNEDFFFDDNFDWDLNNSNDCFI